jgi:TorA maturation chaperone TorD
MMDEAENIQVVLAGRGGVYRILQNLMGNEPNRETLENLVGQASRDVLSLFAAGEGEYQTALTALFAVAEECLRDGGDGTKDAGVPEQLPNAFTRLFVGPGNTEAPPWESLYLTNDGALFQPSTLEVRKAYVAQGFIPQSYPHVADDHLALELDFMARLAEKALEAFSAGGQVGSERAKALLSASQAFLRGHLLKWVPTFATKLREAKHSYFYKEVVNLLETFLSIDLQAIEEVSGAIG